jgi:thiamine-monophosphate kinase
MDISDGLSIDLFRLAKESRVGAEVRLGDVPVFPGASTEQALHGGEDYELLFTAPPKRRVPPSFQGIPLTAIGVITSGRGINLPVRGFQHAV